MAYRVQPVGEAALLVTFAEGIDMAANERVHALAAALAGKETKGIDETVPGYGTLLVQYDPLKLGYAEAVSLVEERIGGPSISSFTPQVVVVPVRYGGDNGPDLGFVAAAHSISEEEVVRRHTAPDYPVMMMGFTPGFPYLGGLDPLLATPRLVTPRTLVLGGSVGIAGAQTGIYPVDSPGGWRIIGRTGLKLFDPERVPPLLLSPGDIVRFTREDG